MVNNKRIHSNITCTYTNNVSINTPEYYQSRYVICFNSIHVGQWNKYSITSTHSLFARRGSIRTSRALLKIHVCHLEWAFLTIVCHMRLVSSV